MKKTTLIVTALVMLFSLKVNAQNERVLLFECFTNTSCGPCASQNPALDALINANADRVAAIKYHMNWPGANDPMYLHNTVDNNARKGVYNVSSVPHTVVDGIRYANVPSGLSQNVVNNWLNIESPFEMRLSYEVDEAANTITVHVMGRASQAVPGTIKLYIGVIEREIHYTSAPGTNGERDFYSVMKKLLPSASGVSIGNVEAGSYFAYTYSWELANVYNNDQLDAIAWIQNINTKEVYQACKSSENIVPFFANEGMVSNITNVKGTNCSGEAAPKVLLTNNGSNALTSAELEVWVYDDLLKTVNWTGNLPTFASEEVELGEVSFDIEANQEKTLAVKIKSVNGGADEAPTNDIALFDFKGSPETVGKVLKLSIRTDANPQETTWKIINLTTGEAVLQGGPYDEANHMYTETLDITGDGCYDFTIYDAGGDGLDGGVYGLKAGGTTLFSGNVFGDSESNEFSYEVTADVEENPNHSINIYPNPTDGMLNIVSESEQDVVVYNTIGQIVFESVCDGVLQIDMKHFGAGIYAIKVGNETQRIVVK